MSGKAEYPVKPYFNKRRAGHVSLECFQNYPTGHEKKLFLRLRSPHPHEEINVDILETKQGIAYFGSAVFPVQDMIEKLSNVSNIL